MDAPDLERLTRELALRKQLQDSLLVFSRALSARLSLHAALGSLVAEAAEIFGTDRVSIWLYNREAGLLDLAASSDPQDQAAPPSLPIDEDSPITRALRGEAPELTGEGAGRCLGVPLRGWRRALGTLSIEGDARGIPDGLLVDLAGEFARQLSAAIENLLVLEDAIRRHGENEQMRAQVAQSQKLASLGQVVASIAHEMNNPLQGVLGHLELLLHTFRGTAADRATLNRIYSDAERASKIVQDLLTFGGMRRAAKQPVDVHRLITETIAIREATPHRARIEFLVSARPDLPAVLGDEALLQQVLLNIIVNAEQAIANAAGAGQVSVGACRDGDAVTIDIEDTGPGIDADLLPRIFDPFFTTKGAGQGTGLGLAITFGIVHEHRGTIAAGASTRGGARFTIRLPAAQ